MAQIITGQKKVLYRKDVPQLKAPLWPELALNELWPQFKADAMLMEYLPNSASKKNPPREFVWGVLQSLQHDYCEKLIGEAFDKRQRARVKPNNAKTLVNVGVTQEWARVLLA